VSSGTLPVKLNPILQALIKSLRIETDAPLQQRAAATLARVLQLLSTQNNSAAVSKLVKNLLILFHSHRDEVQRQRKQQRELILTGALDPSCLTMFDCLFLFLNFASIFFNINLHFRPLTIDVTLQLAADGAKYVFIECVPFASVVNSNVSVGHLFDHHIAWQLIWQAATAALLTNSFSTEMSSSLARDLELLRIIIPTLFHADDRVAESVFQQLLPLLLKCTSNLDDELRSIAAQCICEIGKRCTNMVMELLVRTLHDSNNDCSPRDSVDSVQLGQMELIARILSQIPLKQTSAYLILLVSPVLACIGNSKCEQSRRLAAASFGALMRLLTVDSVENLSGMSDFSRKLRDQQRHFMDQLTGQTSIDKFKLPFQLARGAINPRDYQVEGISWLRFLHRSHLNGALCDDMGLGKTLQALCAVAASAAEQKLSKQKVSHSLIVCPATLLGHWKAEVEHLIPNDLLRCQLYSGTSRQRADVLTALSAAATSTVLIVSYDSLRLDVSKLSLFAFDYCILDEGHQIRNAKAAVSIAAKQIRAAHRLILTGTPIQNDVLELWSLFDFLMPGYLGNESEFQENFSRPILNGYITGASPTAVAASQTALANLHTQTQPFLLRRTKDQVLSDLPPKVMQDRICVMSEVQQQLYSAFIESSTALRILNEQSGDQPTSRALQELMYLRKLCTHPALVLSKEHPEYQRIQQQLDKQNMSIHDIALSPKLLALEQILLDCGIGHVSESPDAQPLPAAQHRVLIFAQLRASLDLVVDSLFHARMPHVKFARIDGSMTSTDRFAVAQRFQRDLDIDVLLLTTHVGGLGLNLQAADVVVFLEHDFNPMMDLQAADRAHRLGQRRSVHVYRLLMQDTLEERIMNIQRFKAFVAAAVVGDNSGSTTSSMLDVIGATVSDETEQLSKRPKPRAVDQSAMSGEVPATLLGSLSTLWDPKQYDEEFNLDSFVAELSNRK
jgi:TATA-binding protein-associated factor